MELDAEEAAVLSAIAGEPITQALTDGDFRRVSQLLLAVTAEEEARAWVALLEVRARPLVGRYWEEIEAVAAALLEHGTLSGPDVRHQIETVQKHRAARF